MGGLRKYWDGYDNQPIVVIDDPGLFDPMNKGDDVHAFKSIISAEEHLVEIKFGSMQFDSHLVIIITNYDAGMLANSAGLENQDAVMDRLVGSRSIIRSALYIPNKDSARIFLVQALCKILRKLCSARFHYDLDIDAIPSMLEPPEDLYVDLYN